MATRKVGRSLGEKRFFRRRVSTGGQQSARSRQISDNNDNNDNNDDDNNDDNNDNDDGRRVPATWR